jgi:SAM-dependent methyltransferase
MSTREIAASSPERYRPEEMAGRLIEPEHFGRYWWAAQLVPGRKVLDAGCGTGYGSMVLASTGAEHVLGLDVAPDAVAAAQNTGSGPLTTTVDFAVGDVRALELPDSSIDVVFCFEVIEHIECQADAIAEFRRVLRHDGCLAVSSPNRAVYPQGNPHHIHEFLPDELSALLHAHFPYVALQRQAPWLASAILPDEESAATGLERCFLPTTVKSSAVEPGRETFSVALASCTALPPVRSLVALGDPFDLKWWDDKLATATAATHDAQRELLRSQREVARTAESARVSASRLLALEEELASTQARVLALEFQTEDRSEEIRTLTLERDQATGRVTELAALLDRADDVMSRVKSSLSWRTTAPGRAVKRWFRRS